MKRIILISLICMFVMSPLTKMAAQDIQQLKIGYVNTTELLESLPQKKEASATLEDLNKKYKEELSLMQNDYNKKYSDFITYQNSMGENIKLRRMQELSELEKSINDFIKVAQSDVESHEKQLLEPLREILKKAIGEVGLENNITCIYDTASPSVVFLTPNAINLNDLVKQKITQSK
ncbi:MAG: outer membrane protein [Bacteroidetes bacterium]|jgi:outer membrane protein|nr:outer membrane protein [Bacteroidota bacterium]